MPHAKEVVKCLHQFWRNLSLHSLALFPVPNTRGVIPLRLALSELEIDRAPHTLASCGRQACVQLSFQHKRQIDSKISTSANHFSREAAPRAAHGPRNAEALRTVVDHQKLTFMLIAAGVPKKLNQDLVKCDTEEEDSVAYHTSTLFKSFLPSFYAFIGSSVN